MPIIFLLFSLFFSSESTFTSKSVHGSTKETTKKIDTPTDGREYIIMEDTTP
ncbi:MAG: hypothetical protein IPL27_05220 [Lewinellaceae bacterium]|nr:hypothetical protein [Lewinellaceae bacterium]